MASPASLTAAGPAATKKTRVVDTRPYLWPSVMVLFLWMIVPLLMTLYFSVIRYNLLDPTATGFVGLQNYAFLFEDPALWSSLWNTLVLVGSILIITVVLGTLLAVLYNTEFPGRNIARLLVIAPFFVMPTLQFDVGYASAGGVIAVILANIVAIFLVRTVSRNLQQA